MSDILLRSYHKDPSPSSSKMGVAPGRPGQLIGLSDRQPWSFPVRTAPTVTSEILFLYNPHGFLPLEFLNVLLKCQKTI